MAVPRPGTTEHGKLKDLIELRLRQSEDLLSARHKRWKESERSYRLFVDPDQIQEPIEPVSKEQTRLYPYATSIVVPLSYAIAQTIISFNISLFTNSVPWMRVGNRNAESAAPAKAQELVLGYQLEWNQYPLKLYQWMLDTYRYGIGIMRCEFAVEERIQTVRRTQQIPILGQMIDMPFTEKRPVLEYEGNKLDVIDPFSWRPDLRHPVAQFQKGSYCGEQEWRSYFDLLQRQREGLFEHVEEIPSRTHESMQHTGSHQGQMRPSDRDRIMQTNRAYGERVDPTDAGMVLVETAGVDIIPRDVGIGTSTQVERYYVTLANRTVLIRAEPYPFDHQDYNYAIIESSPDTHATLNPGLIELMEPMSQHISWLYNSHIENTRKMLNNQLVYDPTMVEEEDVLNPAAGKLWRLTEAFYGSGQADKAVHQLQVQDATKGQIETAQVLQEMMQRLSAANDAIQGQQDEQNRTATEVTTITNLASGRLRMAARLMGIQGLAPLAKQMAQNNMHLLSGEQYVRLAGQLEEEYQGIGRSIGGGVSITPEDVQGLFDYPIFDATSPLDPIRTTQAWLQVSRFAIENPALTQGVNHMALFKQVVHSMGITDLARFLLPQQMNVMPDEQVAQQVQAGNLVQEPNSVEQETQPPPSPSPNGRGVQPALPGQ
jgi:hypothetical protein